MSASVPQTRTRLQIPEELATTYFLGPSRVPGSMAYGRDQKCVLVLWLDLGPPEDALRTKVGIKTMSGGNGLLQCQLCGEKTAPSERELYYVSLGHVQLKSFSVKSSVKGQSPP